jgi:pimeloyl-ACP methyl ester carboxylesterase
MLHYRGYGGSSGKPTEEALHSDARALYEMVHARHPDVIVVGRSLGSGVAVQLAATRQVTRLVLITPFDSIVNLASRQFPFVPVDLLLRDRFESWRYAPQVTAPTLIIAAANDEVVPRESTLALFNAFGPGVATMTTISGAGHNSISSSPGYMATVRGQE